MFLSIVGRSPSARRRRLTPRGWLGSLIVLGLTWASRTEARELPPLALHPKNPHYFLFRGRPTVLITSGEHYGAVLNLDFDYVRYLDTLRADGFNLTRTFSGAYVEPAGAFKIAANTLAPGTNRFLCPWARSTTPGYPLGGTKFDLTRWDPAYFGRLKEFLTQAGRRGIVVELNLFCPFYEESQWALSPQNPTNNINGLGTLARTNAYTLDRNGGLLAVQDALVRKLVTELQGFDNLYYEICNEPYFGGVTRDWQHHIAGVITSTEHSFRHHHLISQNIANGAARVQNPDPAVSIFNFHYATPPDAVRLNYNLDRVIGDNETGFRGTNNLPYRREAWEFLLAGGGLFNNLDYSFTAGHEDGAFVYPATQPGGGNPEFRRQLRVLHEFMTALNLIGLRPDISVIAGGLPPGFRARGLAQPGTAYAIYLCRMDNAAGRTPDRDGSRTTLRLTLPRGSFRAVWVNPVSGQTEEHPLAKHSGGPVSLSSPPFTEDMALRVQRTR